MDWADVGSPPSYPNTSHQKPRSQKGVVLSVYEYKKNASSLGCKRLPPQNRGLAWDSHQGELTGKTYKATRKLTSSDNKPSEGDLKMNVKNIHILRKEENPQDKRRNLFLKEQAFFQSQKD